MDIVRLTQEKTQKSITNTFLGPNFEHTRIEKMTKHSWEAKVKPLSWFDTEQQCKSLIGESALHMQLL